MSGAWAIGAATGPAVGGYVYDVRGDYFSAFLLGAVSLFIAAMVIVPIRKGNRSQVQGSTFRVRDKDKIEDPKSS